MKNKYIESAIRKTMSEEVINISAKANGIYVEGDRMDNFVSGMITACYSMGRTLGMKQDDVNSIINDCWRSENDKSMQ